MILLLTIYLIGTVMTAMFFFYVLDEDDFLTMKIVIPASILWPLILFCVAPIMLVRNWKETK